MRPTLFALVFMCAAGSALAQQSPTIIPAPADLLAPPNDLTVIPIGDGGKVKRGHAFARHHLGLKSRKRKRRLGSSAIAEKTEKRQLQKLLPYGT